MTETTTPIAAVETRAAEYLAELLTASGAAFATEQQWRAFCDRPELVPAHEFEDMIGADGQPLLDHQGKVRKQPRDLRARGFRIPAMLEHGLIEESSAVFHASRNGVRAAPVPIYRPA